MGLCETLIFLKLLLVLFFVLPDEIFNVICDLILIRVQVILLFEVFFEEIKVEITVVTLRLLVLVNSSLADEVKLRHL